MLKLTLIAVGSLKERYLREAAAEYEKRLAAFCRPEIVELREERLSGEPSPAEIAAALDREGERILAAIPPRAYVIALAVEGREFSSEALAAHLAALTVQGVPAVTCVIGSSFGLSPRVKARAELLLSVSRLTFPHQLMRPLTLELLYRCLSITAGTRYHK